MGQDSGRDLEIAYSGACNGCVCAKAIRHDAYASAFEMDSIQRTRDKVQ